MTPMTKGDPIQTEGERDIFARAIILPIDDEVLGDMHSDDA